MMLTLLNQDIGGIDRDEKELDKIELKSWPKKIDHLEELPQQYHPYLQSWLDKGMPVKHLTYIPREDVFCEQPEYVLCWMDDKVMMLKTDMVGLGRSVKRIVLTPQNIVRIDYSVTLLHCQVAFTYISLPS